MPKETFASARHDEYQCRDQPGSRILKPPINRGLVMTGYWQQWQVLPLMASFY